MNIITLSWDDHGWINTHDICLPWRRTLTFSDKRIIVKAISDIKEEYFISERKQIKLSFTQKDIWVDSDYRWTYRGMELHTPISFGGGNGDRPEPRFFREYGVSFKTHYFHDGGVFGVTLINS